MKPQLTDRVVGKDHKVYLVSTMRYQQRNKYEEVWETAVFEGSGCLTLGRKQRFSGWAFDQDHAQLEHAQAVLSVRDYPSNYWLMKPEAIAAERKTAIEFWEKPPRPFGTFPEDEEEV